jgi:hypothetical protein
VPIHYRFASKAVPEEEAMLLSLLATLYLFRFVDTKQLWDAGLYAFFLMLCLYTQPFSYLPAIGYPISMLLFARSKEVRHTMWVALPATALPVLVYLPYAFWAHPRVSPTWLFDSDHFLFDSTVYLVALRELTALRQVGFLLSPLFLAGAMAGAWRAIKLPEPMILKRVKLFCLAGGLITTLVLALVIDNASNSFFSSNQILWAVPALVMLVTAMLDWLVVTLKLRIVAAALAVLFLAICVAGDVDYLQHKPDDLRIVTNQITREMADDSCVVFVSENLSRDIFLVFNPDLARHECFDFFHKRIVLASHPFVRPDQQQDAESFFRGLNYAEHQSTDIGRSKIIILEPKK